MSLIGWLRVFVSKTTTVAAEFGVWPGFSQPDIGNAG